MQTLTRFGQVVLATALKDFLLWLYNWKTLLTGLVMPAAYVLIALVGAQAVGRSPVALVVLDRGPIAEQVAQAIVASDVFRVSRVDAPTAVSLYRDLDVGAILTIPAGFSHSVAGHHPAAIAVQVNNLNLDFTNDVRRSVPAAITTYYQTLGDRSPLKVQVDQRNLRPRDVELFQYEIVPMMTLLVTVSGLIATSSSTALEIELLSIKEIALAPVSRVAVLLGKCLAGWVGTCAMGLLLLAFGDALGWTRPTGVYLGTTILALALVALLATTLGITLGSLCRRVQTANVLSTTGSVWLFFLAGGLGIIQFEPLVLKQIAAFDPLTYGTHLLQLSIFYQSFDQLGRDVAILVGTTLALFALSVYVTSPRVLFRKDFLCQVLKAHQ